MRGSWLGILWLLLGSSIAQTLFPVFSVGSRGGCPVGICQPVVDCAGRLNAQEKISLLCDLGNNQKGLCCKPYSSKDVESFNVRETSHGDTICPANILANPQVRGLSFSARIKFPITELISANPINSGSSAYYHNGHQAPKPEAIQSSQIALEGLESVWDSVIVPFGNSVCRTQNEDLEFAQHCPKSPPCDPKSKYRNQRGYCNNLRDPILGAVFTPIQRLIHSAYYDGLTSHRRASNGDSLPSARLVSTSMTGSKEAESPIYTNLLMTMGQFLDHDLVHVPVHRQKNGETIDCCSSDIKKYTLQCFPISIPKGDRAFGNRSCINFVRSLPAPDIDCKPGPNQQQNQITHWLDASHIYGSTEEETYELCSFLPGRLKMQQSSFLPTDHENEECVDPKHCFLAGDGRVNEQISLVVFHTVWVRLHNQIADKLGGLNPYLEDKILFQETKRIVTALWQHVVYNEWLPVVLGPKLMETFGLWTLRRGFSNDYRNDFDPRITNEFASAAFRVGHTMIPSFLKAFSLINRRLSQQFQLRSIFNDPGVLHHPGVFDEVALGMVIQNVGEFDDSFTEEVTNHLFERSGVGIDLIALNIQRGRDHGTPGYIHYREICGLGKVRHFEDLESNISKDKIDKLKKLYKSVDDIDLFMGMTLENKFRDSFVGQTFVCIIGDQFARLKKGDRFFYDLSSQSGSFTEPQLDEIRKFSLARLMCDTTGIEQIQPFVLENQAYPYNNFTECNNYSGIPKLDFGVFEYKKCYSSKCN